MGVKYDEKGKQNCDRGISVLFIAAFASLDMEFLVYEGFGFS